MNSFVKTPSWFHYSKYNWKQKHAIIIGAGIAGAQMAWHLCQENWHVTLIERHNSLATEASGNLAGVLTPKMTAQESPGEDFYTRSFNYTLSQLATLQQHGHKIKMDNCGALQLAHNPREEKRWQALKERKLPADFIQLLNEKETNQIAGIELHPEYKSCYFPNGGWISPASFVHALVEHPNCKVINQSEAIHIEKHNNLWHVFNNKQQIIDKSEIVIISSGKDLMNFPQSNFLPGMPVAGQTTIAESSKSSRKLKMVIGHEGYLTPTIQSVHVFGATFQRGSDKPVLESSSDNKNLKCLQQYLPEIADSFSSIRGAHTAVRMTTPDRFPYVGALPDKAFYQDSYPDLHQGKQWKQYPDAKYQEGLFVLGGLGSRGIITSGYSAKALTDLLQNRLESEHTKKTLLNCHPARFLIKKLKRPLHER